MRLSILILLIISLLGIERTFCNNEPVFYLLTCSQGEESYSAWGHSALRIVGQNQSQDVVYNFGVFDFNTPHFYLKFLKGKLMYKLEIQQYNDFIKQYKNEDRTVTEQELNLADSTKERILNRLNYLYEPENRYYFYSFTEKNCTSIIRDLILCDIKLGKANLLTTKTPRILINKYLNNRSWTRFEINLIFGSFMDTRLNVYQSLFLPDYLMNEIIKTKSGAEPMVRNTRITNVGQRNRGSKLSLIASPFFIIIALFVIIFLDKSRYSESIFLSSIGILGLTIMLIMLISSHKEVQNNFNLLWCNPLYLILAIFQILNKVKFQIMASVFSLVMLLLTLIIATFKVQQFEPEFYLLIATLAVINLRIIITGDKWLFISSF